MPVFRIEKTQNYTIMSNHHLRNAALSLKAKGLLSQMLSLPENWDYTLAGLSHINREKIDAIREAIKELEAAGYIIRSRVRDEKGRLQGADYIIYEFPQNKPEPENADNKPLPPTLDFPTLDNPTLEKPALGNPTQLNTDKVKTDSLNTDRSNTDSFPFPSFIPPARGKETKGTDASSMRAFEIYRKIIMRNLEYDQIAERFPRDKERIDEIVDIILETICTARKTIRVAGDDYPAELVKAKLMELNGTHLEFVLECMKKNISEIRNIKKYLLAVLFNAPSTIDNYYTAQAAHDMASGKI